MTFLLSFLCLTLAVSTLAERSHSYEQPCEPANEPTFDIE